MSVYWLIAALAGWCVVAIIVALFVGMMARDRGRMYRKARRKGAHNPVDDRYGHAIRNGRWFLQGPPPWTRGRD